MLMNNRPAGTNNIRNSRSGVHAAHLRSHDGDHDEISTEFKKLNRLEWFAIDYRCRFWTEKPGKHQFALVSGDGSKLYNGNSPDDNRGVAQVW
jgi:hypothetical protein